MTHPKDVVSLKDVVVTKDVVTTAVILSYRKPPAEQQPPLLALPAPDWAAAPEPATAAAATPAPMRRAMYFFSRQPGALKAGIRHLPSGTMTVTHSPLKDVLSTLSERAGIYGTIDPPRWEAVVVDWRHRVCAGFWP